MLTNGQLIDAYRAGGELKRLAVSMIAASIILTVVSIALIGACFELQEMKKENAALREEVNVEVTGVRFYNAAGTFIKCVAEPDKADAKTSR